MKSAELFKALSDPARLRIVHLLLQAGIEICSCEICDSLLEPQYAVSRNMKILKYAGLVNERKDGKWVYYSPKRPSEKFYKAFYETLKFLSDSEETLKDDLKRLKARMKLRQRGKCLIGIQNKELAS